eukprot:433744_1
MVNLKITLENVVVLTTSAFCILIAVPLLLYHGYKYYLNKGNVIFYKRYASITICEVMLAVIKFILDGTALFVIAMFVSTNNDDSVYNLKMIPDLMVTIANIPLDFITYLWVIRFVLLSFNLNFTNVMLNYKWQHIINPNDAIQDSKLLWYQNNKSRFNNISWLAKLLCPVVIIQII